MNKTRTMLLGTLGVMIAATAFAAGGGHGEAAEITFMGDWFPRLVNFAIISAVLVYFLRKPTRDFFKARTAEIERSLRELRERAANLRAEAPDSVGRAVDGAAAVIDRHLHEIGEARAVRKYVEDLNATLTRLQEHPVSSVAKLLLAESELRALQERGASLRPGASEDARKVLDSAAEAISRVLQQAKAARSAAHIPSLDGAGARTAQSSSPVGGTSSSPIGVPRPTWVNCRLPSALSMPRPRRDGSANRSSERNCGPYRGTRL